MGVDGEWYVVVRYGIDFNPLKGDEMRLDCAADAPKAVSQSVSQSASPALLIAGSTALTRSHTAIRLLSELFNIQ